MINSIRARWVWGSWGKSQWRHSSVQGMFCLEMGIRWPHRWQLSPWWRPLKGNTGWEKGRGLSRSPGKEQSIGGRGRGRLLETVNEKLQPPACRALTTAFRRPCWVCSQTHGGPSPCRGPCLCGLEPQNYCTGRIRKPITIASKKGCIGQQDQRDPRVASRQENKEVFFQRNVGF